MIITLACMMFAIACMMGTLGASTTLFTSFSSCMTSMTYTISGTLTKMLGFVPWVLNVLTKLEIAFQPLLETLSSFCG